ncbi:MAG: hypothetical protein AB7Q37_17155 [Pyrinomonadaceae bacterium]
MEDLLYNAAYWMLVFQIAINAGSITFRAAVTGYGLLRRENFGDVKINILNEVGFAAFSLVAGIVLMKLLANGTLVPLLAILASAVAGFIDLPVNYFYRKRVPTPDQLETQNRYLPNTTAQTYIEEVEMLSRERDRSDTEPKK